jgi:hypothetical protein
VIPAFFAFGVRRLPAAFSRRMRVSTLREGLCGRALHRGAAKKNGGEPPYSKTRSFFFALILTDPIHRTRFGL